MSPGPPTKPPTEAPMSSSSGDQHLSPRSTPHSQPENAGGVPGPHAAGNGVQWCRCSFVPVEDAVADGPPTDRPRDAAEAAHAGVMCGPEPNPPEASLDVQRAKHVVVKSYRQPGEDYREQVKCRCGWDGWATDFELHRERSATEAVAAVSRPVPVDEPAPPPEYEKWSSGLRERPPVVPVDDEPRNPYRTLHARMSPPGAAWDEGFTAAVTGIIEWFRAEAPLLMDEESRAGNYRAAQKIAERFGGTDEQQ